MPPRPDNAESNRRRHCASASCQRAAEARDNPAHGDGGQAFAVSNRERGCGEFSAVRSAGRPVSAYSRRSQITAPDNGILHLAQFAKTAPEPIA